MEEEESEDRRKWFPEVFCLNLKVQQSAGSSCWLNTQAPARTWQQNCFLGYIWANLSGFDFSPAICNEICQIAFIYHFWINTEWPLTSLQSSEEPKKDEESRKSFVQICCRTKRNLEGGHWCGVTTVAALAGNDRRGLRSQSNVMFTNRASLPSPPMQLQAKCFPGTQPQIKFSKFIFNIQRAWSIEIIVTKTCGDVTAINGTFFQSDGYPSTFDRWKLSF